MNWHIKLTRLKIPNTTAPKMTHSFDHGCHDRTPFFIWFNWNWKWDIKVRYSRHVFIENLPFHCVVVIDFTKSKARQWSIGQRSNVCSSLSYDMSICVFSLVSSVRPCYMLHLDDLRASNVLAKKQLGSDLWLCFRLWWQQLSHVGRLASMSAAVNMMSQLCPNNYDYIPLFLSGGPTVSGTVLPKCPHFHG